MDKISNHIDRPEQILDELSKYSSRLDRMYKEYDDEIFKAELITSFDPAKPLANLKSRLRGDLSIDQKLKIIRRYYDMNIIKLNLFHIHRMRRKSDIFFENRSLFAEIFNALTQLSFKKLQEIGYGTVDIEISVMLLGNIAREDWVTNEVDWTPVYQTDCKKTSTGKYVFGYVQEWKAIFTNFLTALGIRSHVERINTASGTISDFKCHANLKYPGIIHSTKILNARYLTGDVRLINHIINSAMSDLIASARTVAERMVKYWTHHMPQLDEIDLSQPNLKEGYGRLRWINQICWLSRLVYSIEEMNTLRALKSMYAAGLLTTTEEHTLQKAFIFYTEAMYHLYLLDHDDFTLLPAKDTSDMQTLIEYLNCSDYDHFLTSLKHHTHEAAHVWLAASERILA